MRKMGMPYHDTHMHPLNPYHDAAPDFADLARKSGKLTSPVVDFRDGEALRGLTEATLEHDFGLRVSLRDDRLCPPVPNRLNYIAWLQEVLEQTRHTAQTCFLGHNGSEDDVAERPAKRARTGRGDDDEVRVLDIGTGSTCIYPILGAALHGWHFLATDIDVSSLETARATIEDEHNNGQSQARLTKGRALDLRSQIHLVQRDPHDDLLLTHDDLLAHQLDRVSWPGSAHGLLYHAVMCNPPFYTSGEEMQASADLKEAKPSAICDGSAGEMVCAGGEVAFISRIIAESRALGEEVIWFTSMVGKLSSIPPLRERLRSEQIDNYFFTQFVQGRTKRWAVAWSHQAFRMGSPPMVPLSTSLQTLKSTSATLRLVRFGLLKPTSDEELMASLLARFTALSIPWTRPHATQVIVLAVRDTWTRKARRRAKTVPADECASQGPPALCVQIALHLDPAGLHDNFLEAGWMYGKEASEFEGFVKSVLRRWAEPLGTSAGE